MRFGNQSLQFGRQERRGCPLLCVFCIWGAQWLINERRRPAIMHAGRDACSVRKKDAGCKVKKRIEEIGKEVDTRGPQRSGRMFVIHLPLREKLKNNSDTHQGVDPKLVLVPTSF